MIAFNSENENLITGYIKEFLHEFNLPKVSFITPEEKAYFDEKPPEITEIEYAKRQDLLVEGNFYLCVNDIYQVVRVEDEGGWTSHKELKFIKRYIFGETIRNVTKNLIIKSNTYDSYTHEYLGDYLRFIRDYKGVNLMSMYNCFCGETCLSLDLQIKPSNILPAISDTIEFTTDDKNFKIYVVPVKPFELYTIAFDCDKSIEIVAGFYANGHLVVEDSSQALYHATYQKLSCTRFRHPFVYTKISDAVKDVLNLSVGNLQLLSAQQDNLVLFIKVPSTAKSALTVLEGDYSANCEVSFDEYIELESGESGSESDDFNYVGSKTQQYNFVVNNYEADEPESGDYSRNYVAPLQLLNINSCVSRPFADRLVEFIIGSAVTPLDDIDENKARILERLRNRYKEGKLGMSSSINKFNKIIRGDFNKEMRNVLYDIAHQSKLSRKKFCNRFDTTGYVDKDIEHTIGEDE